MWNRRQVLAGIGAIAGTQHLTHADVAFANGGSSPLAGNWMLQPGQTQIDMVTQRVTALLDDMTPINRLRSQHWLMNTVVPTPQLSIGYNGVSMTVSEPGRPMLTVLVDGSDQPWLDSFGYPQILRFHLPGQTLVQTVQGRIDRYNILDVSQGRLRMRTRITGDRFPHSLSFSLGYQAPQ
ncbi:MAG: hypothetical protein AAGA48_36180 [Myxococcota bacterium]